MEWRNWLLVLGAPTLVAGLMQYEGLRLVDYPDPIKGRALPTACYGHTHTARLGTSRTKAECTALLDTDLSTLYGPAVLSMVTMPITQGQLDALTDFAYNLGIKRLRHSTLLRKVNAGDMVGAAAEFDRWVYAGGKDCRIAANKCGGIPKRRAWEKARFLSTEDKV